MCIISAFEVQLFSLLKMFQHFSMYSSLQLQEVEGYVAHNTGLTVGISVGVSIYNLSLQNAPYGWPQHTHRLFVNYLDGQKPEKATLAAQGSIKQTTAFLNIDLCNVKHMKPTSQEQQCSRNGSQANYMCYK